MKIKLYGGEFCPYCHMEKDFLKEHNIDFEYVDVQEDHEQAKYLVEQTNQNGVPVLEIIEDGKSEFIIGFDKERIKERLNIE